MVVTDVERSDIEFITRVRSRHTHYVPHVLRRGHDQLMYGRAWCCMVHTSQREDCGKLSAHVDVLILRSLVDRVIDRADTWVQTCGGDRFLQR